MIYDGQRCKDTGFLGRVKASFGLNILFLVWAGNR